MLTINYFASLREELGTGTETLSLPDGVSSVADLVSYLVRERPPSWALMEDTSRVLVAVDQCIVERSHPLKGNEEVAFFPPMTGG